MAHQCLKCGHTYPDGSPQILKGCEECRGTRFFYTEAPLDAGARAALSEKAEVDLERLALGKGFTQGPERRIPTKEELPLGSGKDWVEISPANLRSVVEDVVRRASQKKPVFRVGAAPAPTVAEYVRGQAGDVGAIDAEPEPEPVPTPQAGHGFDIVDELVQETPRPTPAPVRVSQEPRGDRGSAEVVYKRAPRAVPKPVTLAGVAVEVEEDGELRRKARAHRTPQPAVQAQVAGLPNGAGETVTLYPEGQAPETVGVREPGVYELDIKRLMEHQPIVIHKDGTYSLHLPSLMEMLEPKRKR